MTSNTKDAPTIVADGADMIVRLPGFSAQTYPDGIRVSRLLANGDGNTKTRKNVGYKSAGLSLSPHKSAGVGNVCTDASPGCIAGCLDGQGLASVFETIAYARRAKTVLWYRERQWFLDRLQLDCERLERVAKRDKMPACVRLNMFSDIAWENHGIIRDFPNVQFYDYTKHLHRAGQRLPNYWVTFSRSEANDNAARHVLRSGDNVAIVFHEPGKHTGNRSHLQRLPQTWHGFPVVDGDTNDLRFDDPRGRTRGRVIGLRLKAHSNATRQGIIKSGFSVKVTR